MCWSGGVNNDGSGVIEYKTQVPLLEPIAINSTEDCMPPRRTTEPRFVAQRKSFAISSFPISERISKHVSQFFVIEPENLNPCNQGSTIRPRYPTNSEKSGFQLSAGADVIT
ncbi:Uncharacterized protein HZ326_6537 [Fusarium oxysporum f. sp. albedinis]|nr:Uncharacterized protein HZ326_6537 [Fusarium oxysporum f. sp. albedinis]